MPKDTFMLAFSTPIMQRQFEGVEGMNRDLAASLRQMEANNESDDYARSHQGGYYTPGDLIERDLPGLDAYRKLVSSTIQTYIEQAIAHEHQPRTIPTRQIQLWAWGAITREKDYQTPHVHAGATLSAVYYIQTPEPKPDPEGQLDLMTPLDCKEMTFIKSASKTYCRVNPIAGTMVLFPAYIKHYFHPFFGEGERIMIACNARVT